MLATIGERRGGAYEAELVDIFLADADALMAGITGDFAREDILALEPRAAWLVEAAACDEAYLAVADMIDMRMPFTFGHSRAVAALAEAAGKRLGLPADDLRALRWAGLTHDLGELSVPVSTWMKAGPLSARETDAAHLHPYHGERALKALGAGGEPVANLVGHHHERMDGSGYHHGARGPSLSPAARLLAAAEAFQTAREARPYRAALSDTAAAARLRDMARDGKLDADAVEAVLSAAGQKARRGKARGRRD